MLIRPGAPPGPAWMRNISDSLADPNRSRRIMMPFWLFFLVYMLVFIGLTHFVTAVVLSKDYVYESPAHVAGIIAMGGVAVGVIAIGGAAVGIISVGGLSVGVLSLAGLAIGVRAFGGLAIGKAALGALAIGKYAYAGNGAAYGVAEASGRQKEHLIG